MRRFAEGNTKENQDVTPRDALLVSIEDRICTITLNRPERRNALSQELLRSLMNAILEADVNSDVAVVAITGSGEAFCAGADLKDASAGDDAGARFRGPLHVPERSLFEVMIDSRKPLMAVVNGPAVAGGFELALACDLRVATQSAFFAVPEARRGLGAHFASVILPQMVPPGLAMEWLYTGRRVPMDEAQRWGLVNRVVPREKLMAAAMELAADIAKSAPLSLQRMKLTFRKTAGLPLHAGIRLDTGPDPYASEDRKEGAKAFLEKRDPVWKGK